jgi:hypothetical protein
VKYLLAVYFAGGIMAALGLALAGAASVIATGLAVALVALAVGGAVALCIHVAGVACLAVERAKWEGRRALVTAHRQATMPRQLASPASITVDAVVLTPARQGTYNQGG